MQVKGLTPLKSLSEFKECGKRLDEYLLYLHHQSEQISLLLRLNAQSFSSLLNSKTFSTNLIIYFATWLLSIPNNNNHSNDNNTSTLLEGEEWQRDYYSLLIHELTGRILKLFYRTAVSDLNILYENLPLSWFISLLEKIGPEYYDQIFQLFQVLFQDKSIFKQALLKKLRELDGSILPKFSIYLALLVGASGSDTYIAILNGERLFANLLTSLCQTHKPDTIANGLKWLSFVDDWIPTNLANELISSCDVEIIDIVADYLHGCGFTKFKQLAEELRTRRQIQVEESFNRNSVNPIGLPMIDEFRLLLDDKAELQQTKELTLYRALAESEDDDDGEEEDDDDDVDNGTTNAMPRDMRHRKSSLRVNGLDEKLLQVFIANPTVFERSATTRRSSARLALLKETGLGHEQLEGWAILFKRNVLFIDSLNMIVSKSNVFIEVYANYYRRLQVTKSLLNSCDVVET